jgi:ATP-dependent exoDNAse (exonuclease V) alpha subunit
VVFLAKGMSVMVMVNVETEIDIANGSRGVIEEIITHPEEGDTQHGDIEHRLQRPPVCVLVRLAKTRAPQLTGLAKGVVPIVPRRGNFPLPVPGGSKVTIQKEQIPLIPAYAFTDYRAQGQTLPYVIVDIARPPGGGLTQFNAYVALSQSKSSAYYASARF